MLIEGADSRHQYKELIESADQPRSQDLPVAGGTEICGGALYDLA